MINFSFDFNFSWSISHIILEWECSGARLKWTFTLCFTRSFRGLAPPLCAAHIRLKDAKFHHLKTLSQQPVVLCCPLTGCKQQSNTTSARRDPETTKALYGGFGLSLSSSARFMACCSDCTTTARASAAMPNACLSIRGYKAHKKLLQLQLLCLAAWKYQPAHWHAALDPLGVLTSAPS